MGPNLIALAIPLFFVGIALELAVASRRRVKAYRLGDAIGDMGCGVLQQLVSNLLAGWVTFAAYAWVFEHRLFDVPTTWLPWVAALLGVELAYYWWHRLSHEVNLLWAAHVVHHHSEDYNLAVALRQSVTTWATSLPFWLPLALLGIPTTPFAVMLGLTTLYQFWIHTELIGPLGFFEKWLNTPRASSRASRHQPRVPRQEPRRDVQRLRPALRHVEARDRAVRVWNDGAVA